MGQTKFKHITPEQFQRRLYNQELFYPYNYRVEFANLPVTNKDQEEDKDNLQFQAIDLKLPEHGMDTTTFIPLYESPIDLPLKETRGTMEIVFRCSGDLREWKLMSAWRKQVVDRQRVGYYNTYITPFIRIHPTEKVRSKFRERFNFSIPDSDEKSMFYVELTNAFPKAVDRIPLVSEGSASDYAKFSVDFAYHKLRLPDETLENEG